MNKRGRPKKQILYPSVNYTYMLYDLINKKNKKKLRIPGATEEQAKTASGFKKIKIKPSKIKEITDEFGHKNAHIFLKQFGNQWVCKNGQIFFRKINL